MKVFIMRIVYSVEFYFTYTYDLIISNIILAYDILTPKNYHNPRLLYLHLDNGHTDLSILMTSALISINPGTMTVEVDKEKNVLIVHALYGTDVAAIEKKLKNIIERRILRICHGH